MIAPKELRKAIGNWKVAGRIYAEAIKLSKQGIQYNETDER